MENPPMEGSWTTSIRDTSLHLVFQKKSNIKELSILKTHGGMWTRNATYQIRDKARTLMTRVLSRNEVWSDTSPEPQGDLDGQPNYPATDP